MKKKKYNTGAYIKEVIDLLDNAKEEVELKEIFSNIGPEKDTIYRDILSDALSNYYIRVTNQFNKDRKRDFTKEYFWNKYERISFVESTEFLLVKCIDDKPLSFMEKGEFLEKDKLYVYWTGASNIVCAGEGASEHYNTDFSYAGDYSLARFQVVRRIQFPSLPKEIQEMYYR